MVRVPLSIFTLLHFFKAKIINYCVSAISTKVLCYFSGYDITEEYKDEVSRDDAIGSLLDEAVPDFLDNYPHYQGKNISGNTLAEDPCEAVTLLYTGPNSTHSFKYVRAYFIWNYLFPKIPVPLKVPINYRRLLKKYLKVFFKLLFRNVLLVHKLKHFPSYFCLK